MNIEKFDDKILEKCYQATCYQHNLQNDKLHPFLPKINNKNPLESTMDKKYIPTNINFNNSILDNNNIPVNLREQYETSINDFILTKIDDENDLLLNGFPLDTEIRLTREELNSELLNNTNEIYKLYLHKHREKYSLFKN